METDRIFSSYRNMWLIVMFDLPTETAADKKMYHHFRESLLADGFQMVQYSVYLRYCASVDNTEVHEKRVMDALPPS
jgi:CRISPR-associated protein Cas2